MSPKTEEQNRVIRDERREQLLNAALKVFARKGLSASKISDITSEAGLSQGLFYHYFKSKEEIFTEVVRQTLDMSNESMDRVLHIPGNPMDKIRFLTDRNINYEDMEGYANRWLIMIQASSSDAVPEEVKTLVKGQFYQIQRLAELIAEGQKMGQFINEDPLSLSVAYWAMMQGLILFKAYYMDGTPPMPGAETVLRILKPENSK